MNDYVAKVTQVVSDVLGVPDAEIKPEDSLRDDLGADSMALLELQITLERVFGIAIPDRDAPSLTTVARVATYIADKVKRYEG